MPSYEQEYFESALHRKSQSVEAARLSFETRVREFIEHYGYGPKAGRPDYTTIVPLDKFEPIRAALEEYDRVRKLSWEHFDERRLREEEHGDV